MLVAMPTAIPDEPFSSRLGRRLGSTSGSLQRAIEVVAEVDRVLIKIGQQFFGQLVQAGFGVTHGGGSVAIHRAEVALAVHQQIAHGEILGHARHGLVDGRIAVRVVFPQHFPDDAGGFFEGRVGTDAHVLHGIQDAPVNGFQAIPGIRQGARHDDGHGIVKVRRAHGLVNVGHLDGANDLFDWFRNEVAGFRFCHNEIL